MEDDFQFYDAYTTSLFPVLAVAAGVIIVLMLILYRRGSKKKE